jgi:hypothetical protein
MTNRRPQQPTEKVLRQPRGGNSASAKSVDVCELLLAELRERRVRLRELLNLVWMEADRLPARHAPPRPRHKCASVRLKRTA